MTPIQNRATAGSTGLALLLAALVATGCAPKDDGASFDSPDAAVAAFVDALDKGDVAKLQKLLGPGSEDLLASGDAVQDKGDRADFVAEYRTKHSLAADGGDSMTLVIGEKDWPFPIPVVKRNGRWSFDGDKGADELVYRRVGDNELGAISVCQGFVDAETEYAAEGRDDDPAGIYALKLISDEGLHNGLYWPTADDEPPSPAGPFVAAAAEEGYRRTGAPAPYHGYYYRLLFKQGEHANGGAREYFKDGLMTEGFAMLAWPADYQSSGVMTFIVNQDGMVFQKDLGEDTGKLAAEMTAFDPDSSWVAIIDQ